MKCMWNGLPCTCGGIVARCPNDPFADEPDPFEAPDVSEYRECAKMRMETEE